jgi:hypothetical protein
VLMTGGTPGVDQDAPGEVPVLSKPFELADLLEVLDAGHEQEGEDTGAAALG